MKYRLSYSTWGKEEETAIKNIINKSQLTMSKITQVFEEKFAKKLNRKYAVMVNSGSSANLISIASLFYKKDSPLKKGDEVLVPAIAWSTTYTPLQQYGLRVKVIDCAQDSLNVDFNKLSKHITNKTKLIIGVSILGSPAELDKIEQICRKKNIYFFNDNCESLGAKIKKKETGSFGLIASHSFFFSHHISTIEGGMIVTDNYEIYCLLLSLRAHGWTRNLPKKNPLVYEKKQKLFEQYNFILPGYNVRPNEIYAAIGIQQLKKLDKMIVQRRKNLALFEKLFSNIDYLNYFKSNNFDSSFSFPLILKEKNQKLLNRIFKILKDNKIEFRLITGGCFTKHTYAKYFKLEIPEKLINAEYFHNYGFFVGNSSIDLTNQLRLLHKCLERI